MTRIAMRSLLTLLISFGLFAGYAAAENHDHGRNGARREHAREHHEFREHARERHEAREARERHGRFERERMERERHARWEREHRRPAGWDHGRKTGWGNADVPPGHAKNEGRRDDRWHPGSAAPVSSSSSHVNAPVISQVRNPAPQPAKRPWWPVGTKTQK